MLYRKMLSPASLLGGVSNADFFEVILTA
jgi:hypothetical protein